MPRALMSVTPNLCSDETEPRSIRLPDKGNSSFQIFQEVVITAESLEPTHLTREISLKVGKSQEGDCAGTELSEPCISGYA